MFQSLPSLSSVQWQLRGNGGVQVTAILVLYGLPWLLTGTILAHECMHAWLRLRGITRLPLQTEEGLCQLMGLLWLESQDLTRQQVSPLTHIWMRQRHACPNYIQICTDGI